MVNRTGIDDGNEDTEKIGGSVSIEEFGVGEWRTAQHCE